MRGRPEQRIPGGGAALAQDLTRILPYGDTLDDGRVQLSFTLPVPPSPEAEEAALRLLRSLGLHEPAIVHTEDLLVGATFFVAYGVVQKPVDFSTIRVPKAQSFVLDRKEIEHTVKTGLIGRPIRVIGACTGTDAHTVGIDAILNLKGIAGHKGLESYRGFAVKNLGAQVPNEVLIAAAREFDADAVLVSQVVTQKNVHIQNLTRFIELVEAEGLRDRFILVVGGPRITHELAMELGFDAGFGRQSFASHVASFLVQELDGRRSRQGREDREGRQGRGSETEA